MSITPKTTPFFFGKNSTEKELKNKVVEWCKSNLVGKSIFKKDINKTIELSWQGIKNDINEYHAFYKEKLLSFQVLDQIIKNAFYSYSEKDKRSRSDVKHIHRFLSKVIVGRIEFDVVIIIYETSKTYLYDHILIKK